MTKRKRYRYVENVDDMNKIIQLATDNITYIIESNKDYDYTKDNPVLREASYLHDCDRYLKFTTMYVQEKENKNNIVYNFTNKDKYACTWRFDKSGEFDQVTSPSKIMIAANKVYKPYNEVQNKTTYFYRLPNDKIFQSAKPLTGYSEKWNNTEHYCYVYDLNSAYATILKDKIIDTYHWRNNDIVNEGEIGFLLNSDLTLIHCGSGIVADKVFPLIDSPFKDYVRKYYNLKRFAPKGSRAKKEAKAHLNYLVGCWQNSNPFLRAYVVNSCNEFIQNILDKYGDKICMWNTDAVYSVEPLDLDIGTEIGQFKLEYQGLFRQKGNVYQKVDTEEVSYRRISKCLFQKGYNLLTDPLPPHIFKYFWNSDTKRIELNPNYIGD